MANLVKHYGYIKPGEDMHYRSNRGCVGQGQLVGIIVLQAWLPIPPGHVTNACSYDFPVRYIAMEREEEKDVASEEKQPLMKNLMGGDKTLVKEIIRAAKQLELDGCRVICSDGGYFGHFQKEVAAALDTPVFLSSVMQVPFIRAGLRPNQKIGIMCANKPKLTWDLFDSCGVSEADYERCVIYGAQDEPEFSKLDKEVGNFDSALFRKELVGIATKMQQEHPDIGAILLECTDMPPYAASIQSATNLPVFDAVTMIKFLHSVVAQRDYGGYV